MSSEKYIGMDVHQATISVAVLDSQGKTIMESILETKASTLLEFLSGLRGTLNVTFEERTWAAWLYDLLKPHVAKVLVCNPRKIPLLGQVRRRKKQKFIRGLNRDYNHDGMMGSPLGQGEQKTKTRPL
jgi:hypothetical protein